MVERANSRLQSNGQGIISRPLSNRESRCGTARKDMSAEDMVKAIDGKGENARSQRQPQTARALLEENKMLVHQKRENKELARKKSREFIEQLLHGDQKVIEADKAKHVSRRMAQQELARYYKSRIAEKEEEKATSYKSKVDAGTGTHFFPYTEGEHINKTRKAQNALMAEEMRGFLKEQRDTKPTKAGRHMGGDTNYNHEYPESGAPVSPGATSQHDDGSMTAATSKQPRFLTRPTEHMSRRIQDDHVRRALEDKVQRTKEELEAQQRKRRSEAQAWEEGMLVNDALRYDATQSKSSERHKNAEFLRNQIEERKVRDDKAVQDFRAEHAGYFGPDEKQIPGMTPHLTHCSDLITQMEVNQNRRLESRSRRMVQERRLVDNSLAEIASDREVEKNKFKLQREVLVTTWDSQRKIREVLNRIETAA